MQRGDIILCAFSGDYGKVRPAVIIQASLTLEHHTSITVCPITSSIHDAKLTRISITPDQFTGINKPSQIMIDKIITLKKTRIKKQIGTLAQTTLVKVDESLRIWLGLK